MIPEKCIKDAIKVLREQSSQRILFISDGLDSSENFYHVLLNEFNSMISYYNGEDICEKWDTIFISDAILIKDENFTTTLGELLQYVNHSILVFSGTYLNEDNEVIGISGKRHLHPVRFSNFDFTYVEYQENFSYSLYNFYPNEDRCLENFEAAIPRPCPNQKKVLNVLYVLPHLNLTGGMKCLLTHARNLHKRGHNVYLIHPGSDDVIPSWSNFIEGVDFTQKIHCSTGDLATKEIAEKNIDIIVLGFYSSIPIFKNINIPILLWEQGYEYLYGDTKELFSHSNARLLQMRELYSGNIATAAVSPFLASILHAKFGCKSMVLPTGMDTDFYYPLEAKENPQMTVPKILIVGNPRLPFKGFSFLLTTLAVLYSEGYRFSVTWACQSAPDVNVNFPLSCCVNASQQDLANLYRTHDIFISTSIYEAFSMPPLEAMSSGIPVIATDCGGINTYAKPGENLLLVDQGNIYELREAIIYLLENPNARKLLAINGRNTALELSIDKAIDILENILYDTIEHYEKERG